MYPDPPKSPEKGQPLQQTVTNVAERPVRDRPSRAQIQPAALELLSRHSAGLLATARRYSMTPEDAEDAYQRGVEILLTKAPTTSEAELLPWLKTVVKHEAFAVRKASGRALPSEDAGVWEPDQIAWTDERAERYERLRVGAEAMSRLKPQEIRCLLLKAEGLSYKEICEATGWTYTKVNRCLTEGRRAFLDGVARIDSGAECERLAPVISRVADGEATAQEMRTVRPHLKSCLACKAMLREYRAAPARVAGLVPPVALLTSAGSHGPIARLLHALHERVAGVGELAAGQKAVAIAASAAAIAGGGATGVQVMHHDAPAIKPAAFQTAPATPTSSPERRPALPVVPATRTTSSPAPAAKRSDAQPSAAAPKTDTSSPTAPQAEFFGPGAAPASRSAAPEPAPAEFGP